MVTLYEASTASTMPSSDAAGGDPAEAPQDGCMASEVHVASLGRAAGRSLVHRRGWATTAERRAPATDPLQLSCHGRGGTLIRGRRSLAALFLLLTRSLQRVRPIAAWRPAARTAVTACRRPAPASSTPTARARTATSYGSRRAPTPRRSCPAAPSGSRSSARPATRSASSTTTRRTSPSTGSTSTRAGRTPSSAVVREPRRAGGATSRSGTAASATSSTRRAPSWVDRTTRPP